MGNEDREVFEQDLDQEAMRPGAVFMVHLLMEEECKMPGKDEMHAIINAHLGETDCFAHDGTMAGFAVNKYKIEFEDATISPQLMIMDCFEIANPVLNALERSQLWDCPEGEEILEACKYQVIATDMMAAGLDYKDRAEMLVDYIEALVEIYPSCKAVVIESSKKMLTREAILSCDMPKEHKFIQYAVNVRFFNIEGTDDMIVDTIGMSTLFLPDLQYHFTEMDPNGVVNHAYNVLSYIYNYDCPIEQGDTIDGVKDGQMSEEVQWKVQYEESLIQPVREVIDFNMNEHAAGKR